MLKTIFVRDLGLTATKDVLGCFRAPFKDHFFSRFVVHRTTQDALGCFRAPFKTISFRDFRLTATQDVLGCFRAPFKDRFIFSRDFGFTMVVVNLQSRKKMVFKGSPKTPEDVLGCGEPEIAKKNGL